MSASCFKSHIHCSSFLLFSQCIIAVFPTSWRAQVRHYTPGWQLFAISVNVICDTWQEIWAGDMMIKMSLFIGVGGIHSDRPWNCISKMKHVFFFSPFPLKPVVMMSPTCQPDDGWIVQRCTVTFIINNRDNLMPARNIDILMHFKGM